MSDGQTYSAQYTLRRIVQNAGWLLGGKGFGAVSSLIYLAILSRSLGVKDFGHFALIFGIAQAMVAVAGFQTWQTIVRFGAPHIARGDWAAFGRISVAGAMIDAVGATTGCVLATVTIIGFGDALELNPDYKNIALAFICATLWARVSAPYGVIRALDRFELSVLVGSITPALRLLAAILIWLTEPTVARFLFAWAAIEFLTAFSMWFAAWRLRPDIIRFSMALQWRQLLAENPSLLKFVGVTYCSTSIQAVVQQGPLLAVGYFFGTSAAGVYRIADQLAKGLGKLAVLMSDAIYPEVNRQLHTAPAAEFSRTIAKVSLVVVAMALSVGALAAFMGSDILVLIAGEAFSSGGIILVPLVIAGSLELASVAYEPALHSLGKAHYQLWVRLVAAAALIGTVLMIADTQSLAVAWSVTAVQALEYLLLSALIFGLLKRLDRRPARQ
ncbi:lipopolysaccharide biosynthesis protein [Pontixanthobacter sp.]|uniref:lipopolysaccharide biosynthesis protein n=1 Tax=Pontixanthobacter sp. TaxID=2792078 RepID=UPI003C7B5000